MSSLAVELISSWQRSDNVVLLLCLLDFAVNVTLDELIV
jgi:hypothetical protein